MPDRSSPDRPAAPAVPPNVVLPEPWTWDWDEEGKHWAAMDTEFDQRIAWDEGTGIIHVDEDEEPIAIDDRLILAVLEANASPALEERDRRVRAEFAERVAAWLRSDVFAAEFGANTEGPFVEHWWAAEQISRAARGERTL
jgi:hypothetical protein